MFAALQHDMTQAVISVAVDAPQHSGLSGALDYLADQPWPPGTLLRVPLGKRELLGIVWHGAAAPAGSHALRPVGKVFVDLPAMAPAWLALVDFAASYYQRGVGELALAVLPPELRKLDAPGLSKRLARLLRKLDPPPARASRVAVSRDPPPEGTVEPSAEAAAAAVTRPVLGAEQLAALAAFEAQRATPQPQPLLLHGVTGSGKTEVYLHATEQVLAAGRQALVLVPEINLTPQLEARFAERFPQHRMVAMHSGLTPVQRLRHWLMAHLGRADIVLGTRLSVFAPLPRLGLIVVDEEHDPSYKQQEGARYSARDLAVYRAHLERVPVILGSATPSLETWQRAQPGAQQRYLRLPLAQRVGGAPLPQVRLFDMGVLPKTKGQPPVFAPKVLDSLRERLARGEQSLVFLNRRGYAPVLYCADCGWKSGCPHCSAWRVFHKGERTLRCHHCGFTERVPRACPDCGNLDIAPIGRGTEKLEEQLAELLPGARIARLDADTARGKGQLEARLAEVHAGAVDVLVGTQMVTKGHDFRRITLVVAVNPDSALFASDFRAPERLFALLMQAGGRAGRDAAGTTRSEMWVQTWHPQHPLYKALQQHDFAAFAQSQLADRKAAGLPPFSHLALLRAEARDPAVAMAWLQAAAAAVAGLPGAPDVTVYPPVPPSVAKVAGIERLQLLLEAPSRTRLQRVLADWMPALHALRQQHKGLARWAIDVDPLAI
jgi:primosomal protein N' (replication factor Y)